MADHLNVPGAFAYIRLVPDPKPSDDTDSSDKGPTALPVESSVDETAVASEPDADVKDSNEALAPTSAVAKVLIADLSSSIDARSRFSFYSRRPTPQNCLCVCIIISLKQKKTNIAIDAWKQKTHDRRQHHHDFDRFLNEVRRVVLTPYRSTMGSAFGMRMAHSAARAGINRNRCFYKSKKTCS